MNAKQFKLHSKSILIITQHVGFTTNGIPQFDITLMADNGLPTGQWVQWSPTINGLKRLKSNKYRVTGYYEGSTSLQNYVYDVIAKWYPSYFDE